MIDYREICGCGRPLHYANERAEATVRLIIARKGPTVPIMVAPDPRTYWVPRHYVALHGVAAVDLPGLAMGYGWRIDG